MLDEALATGPIAQVRIAILRDLDYSDDLISRDAQRGIVYPPAIQFEPIVVCVAIWRHSKAVPIDADSIGSLQRCAKRSCHPHTAKGKRVQVPHRQADAK